MSMTMIQSEFRQLKQKVVANVGKSGNHPELIEVFKEFYRDDIDSERKFEQIVTIGQLLKILETRDVLSANNVKPLTDIATRLRDNDLLRIICKYERNFFTNEDVNNYVTQHNSNTSHKEAIKFHSSFATLSPEKERRLENTLATEIGTYWRDLARNLKIREGHIDKIDMASNNLEEKAREILKKYKEDVADSNRWFFVLCEALEKSRRKDLSKSLQEIMTMNIM